MADFLRLSLIRGESEKPFQVFIGQAQNLRPVMEQIRALMLDSVRQNFAAGGRPKPWPPLTSVRRGGRPLVRTGHFLSAITSSATNTRAELVSHEPQSLIMQYGGTLRIPAQSGRVFHFMAKDGREVFTRRIAARTATLPARPYLIFQRADLSTIRRLIVAHLFRGQEA